MPGGSRCPCPGRSRNRTSTCRHSGCAARSSPRCRPTGPTCTCSPTSRRLRRRRRKTLRRSSPCGGASESGDCALISGPPRRVASGNLSRSPGGARLPSVLSPTSTSAGPRPAPAQPNSGSDRNLAHPNSGTDHSVLIYWNRSFRSDSGGAVTSTARSHRWRWLAFAHARPAAVMDLLDSTIAQVAAPAIQRDLGGSYAVIEWITAAYTLAMAVGLLTGGRLGDLFGRKRVLLIGMAGIIAASADCAAAVTPGELIAARAVQGAAGAVMLPQVFGLIRDLFAAEEIGKAFAVFSPVMGLSAMLGPIASGGLIGADILGTGWRMIFLVNLPVGVLALLAGARLLPSVPGQREGTRLDLPGAAVAGAAMFLLVFPLVQGRELRGPLWLVVMLASSVPVLAGFAAYQVRRQRAGATPLIEPGIFARRGYAPGIAFSVAFVGSMGGIVLVFNVFLQAGLGFSPWHSALTTAPR